MILTGCSGWSYTDWVDRFYPRELAGRHSEWLRYYAGYFATTEVNSTFYSLPPKSMVDAWISKTRDVERFEFSLKLPKSITHEKLPGGDIEGVASDYLQFTQNCTKPLLDAGKLGAVLIQLPPQLGFSGESMTDLEKAFEIISDGRTQFAVEFRNRGWLDTGGRELRAEAIELLDSFGFCTVITDGPAFPSTTAMTADHAYLRFHGRNVDIWYTGADEDDSRINRYDYLYSRGELEGWASRIRSISELVGTARIYFNNHGRAKAAKNALETMDLLGIGHPPKDIRILDQSKLGSFLE